MVSALKEAKLFAEAAVVLRDYLDDPEEAIASLVEGSRWAEADRLIVREKRADLYGEIHACTHTCRLFHQMNTESLSHQLKRYDNTLYPQWKKDGRAWG